MNKEWSESLSLSLSFSVLTQLLAPGNIHSRSHFPEGFSALILIFTFELKKEVSPVTHQQQICSAASTAAL